MSLAVHQREIIALMTFSWLENLIFGKEGISLPAVQYFHTVLFHNMNKSLWVNVSSLSVDWKRISVSQLVYSVFIPTV